MTKRSKSISYRDSHMLFMFGFCILFFASALIWFPFVMVIDGELQEPVAVVLFEIAGLLALIICIVFSIQYIDKTWIDEKGFHVHGVIRKRNRDIHWSEAKELGISVVPMGASAQYYIYLAKENIPSERKYGQMGMKKSDYTWNRDAIRIPLCENSLRCAEEYAPHDLKEMLQRDSMYPALVSEGRFS